VRLASRLEQRDEHRGRAASGHLERRRLRWGKCGAALAHLGQREPAPVGGDMTPGSGATGPCARGTGDALLPAPAFMRRRTLPAWTGTSGACARPSRRVPEHTPLVQGERRRTWREFDELRSAGGGVPLGPGPARRSFTCTTVTSTSRRSSPPSLRRPRQRESRYTADELAHLLETRRRGGGVPRSLGTAGRSATQS
jgi:hypothetical protein